MFLRLSIAAFVAGGIATLAFRNSNDDLNGSVRRKLFVEVIDPGTASMDLDCGCPSTCTSDILDQLAGDFTCRQHIVMEMAKSFGKNAEMLSCKLIATEFPDICGGHCHPERCPDASDVVAANIPTFVNSDALTHEVQPGVPLTLKPITAELELKYKDLKHLRNMTEPVRETDVPFFFHIFKSAGSTMKSIMGDCYDLVRAHEWKQPASLEISTGRKGGDLVNVHTHRPETIKQAKAMHLIESGVADVIVSSFIYEGAELFNENQQARMFSVFRHPVERAVSLFYYLCHATWENTHNPAYCNETLHHYATRVSELHGIEKNNWVTRRLANVPKGPLREEHLTLAIEVIRSKFLVGLIREMDETMRRVELFFGWKPVEGDCINHLLYDKPENSYHHEKAVEGSEEFNLIAKAYEYDIRLYKAVQEIFKEQQAMFPLQG